MMATSVSAPEKQSKDKFGPKFRLAKNKKKKYGSGSENSKVIRGGMNNSGDDGNISPKFIDCYKLNLTIKIDLISIVF